MVPGFLLGESHAGCGRRRALRLVRLIGGRRLCPGSRRRGRFLGAWRIGSTMDRLGRLGGRLPGPGVDRLGGGGGRWLPRFARLPGRGGGCFRWGGFPFPAAGDEEQHQIVDAVGDAVNGRQHDEIQGHDPEERQQHLDGEGPAGEPPGGEQNPRRDAEEQVTALQGHRGREWVRGVENVDEKKRQQREKERAGKPGDQGYDQKFQPFCFAHDAGTSFLENGTDGALPARPSLPPL